MNTPLTKAVAVGAVCAAALAGSLAAGSTATAGHGAAKGGITKFGYKANVYGTKVVVNGLEVKTVKDALAQQKCTRQLRGEIVKASSISTQNIVPDTVPFAELINVSPSTSKTQTFRTAKGEYGVVGIDTIGDIEIGGEFEGLQTPSLKIEALQSVARSWNDTAANKGNGQFKADSRFGFGDISLQLNGLDPTGDLQDLVDIITEQPPGRADRHPAR